MCSSDLRDLLTADHLDLVFRVIRIAAGVRIQNNQKDRAEIDALLTDVDELVARTADGEPVIGPTENWASGGPFDHSALKEHTTSMSVADSEGNVVCLTQSLGSPYGSGGMVPGSGGDRKSTRLNSSHVLSTYAVFCLKKTKKKHKITPVICFSIISSPYLLIIL